MKQFIAGALLSLLGAVGVILSTIALRIGWLIVLIAVAIDLYNGNGFLSALWEATWVTAAIVAGGLLGLALSAAMTALGLAIVDDA